MDHVRIDDGIKRGKRRTPQKTKRAPLAPLTGKLANLNASVVLDRYLQDEDTKDIAQSLGVHRSGLNQWLLRNAEDEWRQAQIARAVTALETAKTALAEAPDALSLARAREQLRGAQWELERLYARLFAQKQEVSSAPPVHININLGQAKPSEIAVSQQGSQVIDVVDGAAQQG